MRSKPNPVDQPERDSSVNIPLPPDQHHRSYEVNVEVRGSNKLEQGEARGG